MVGEDGAEAAGEGAVAGQVGKFGSRGTEGSGPVGDVTVVLKGVEAFVQERNGVWFGVFGGSLGPEAPAGSANVPRNSVPSRLRNATSDSISASSHVEPSADPRRRR